MSAGNLTIENRVDRDQYMIGSNTSPTNIIASASFIDKKYAWAKSSNTYHDATCPDLQHIKTGNLVFSDTPPTGKKKHDCPDNQ
jgi:hypothetical protein